MSLKKIYFEDSDFPHPTLEPIAEDIADFLIKSNYMFIKFTELMRISVKWKVDTYKPLLTRWCSRVVGKRKNAAADTLKLAELAQDFFDVCSDNEDILKMRGLVPEKLFEKIFNMRHDGKLCNKGYGVKVILEGNTIIYNPQDTFYDEEKLDSDRPRRTVDAGYWDGKNGEFVEIKLNPEGYQTKDINYLRLLSKELSNSNVSFVIFLVSLGDKDLTKNRLRRLDINVDFSENSEFCLVGQEELYDLRFVG